MALIEMGLILIYVCVLLIKTCQYSTEICKTYGLGDDANGEPLAASCGGYPTSACLVTALEFTEFISQVSTSSSSSLVSECFY